MESRAGIAVVFVAAEGERILGSATLELAERIESDDPPLPADERDPDARGPPGCPPARGRSDVDDACFERARAMGKTRMTPHTTHRMKVARTMYERMGFRRLPDRVFPTGSCSSPTSARPAEAQPPLPVRTTSPDVVMTPTLALGLDEATAELLLVQRVQPAALEQLRVPRSTMRPRSTTKMTSACKDRGQAVGDRDRRPAVHQRFECGLHQSLGGGIQAGRSLVQDQDARVLQDHAGDRETLLLAARELVPALADDGVVAVGQLDDPVVDVRGPRSLIELVLRGVRPPVQQVPPDRGVEQVGLLRDDADQVAEGLERDPRTSTSSIVTAPRRSSQPGNEVGRSSSCPQLGPTSAASCPGGIRRSTPSSVHSRIVSSRAASVGLIGVACSGGVS